MTVLIILSHPPYDGSDVAWNALRLAASLQEAGRAVRLFLINDGIDAARPAPPEVEFDLAAMVTERAAAGAEVLACGTCLTRCGVSQEALVEGATPGSMTDLAAWIGVSDRVVTF